LIMWLIIATVEVLFFADSWAAASFNLAVATMYVVAVFRFGLLTTMVFHLVFSLSALYPLTTDLSIWYANRGIFAVIMMAAMASYGAYVSLGGQRMFQSKLLGD